MKKISELKIKYPKCYFCKKSTQYAGIVLSNYDKKGSKYEFRFLPKGKSACLECYIENGVKQSIKKYLKGRKK